MKRPTPEQIAVACEWLDLNEGDNDEAEACQAVIVWLEHLQSEHELQTAARRAGVPVSIARRAVTKVQP